MRQISGVTLLLLASAAYSAAQADPPGRVGRLNYIDGPVSFQPASVNDWVDASLNRPLIAGDNVWIGDRGRSELHVGSTALRLGANTSLEFLNLDDQGVQIRLAEGTLTVRMRNLPQDQVFEIDTPNMAFTLSRPGEYRIDANPDSQSTIITVREGEGEVTGGGDNFPVYARQQVIVRGNDQITYNVASSPAPDQWDQWCSARDQREDQSQSARFVSREVAGYDDLDQYGRWDNQPGYGSVWMPTSVDAGWAPYHDGHWAWISPWGWTWVDDAPWGFAPYHYGRWASFGGRWGWIPGPFGVTPVYAPALVAWVGGGGGAGFSLSFSIGSAAAVGWFPLGPREPYFPSYQASRGYFTRVNNTNTVINNTTINNYYDSSRNNNGAITNIQYANRNVQNSVTAVPRDTFARGRRVTQDARPVPANQLASVQVFGAPAIAPQRESVLGVRADTASKAPRPPANVVSRPVVARRAPPPAPVPFDRQQPGLAKNPGRPLPAADVQQMRQGAAPPSPPVRVVDMSRIRRVQPTVGTQTPAPQQPPFERQKGRQQSQPQAPTPQAAAPPTPAPQQPPFDRQKGRPQPPQTPTPQAAAPPTPAPQQPPFDRQKGRPQQPQTPTPQAAAPPTPAPQQPPFERQKGRQQSQPQAPTPQAAAPPTPATQQPPFERQKGRQQPQQQPQQPAPAPAPEAKAPQQQQQPTIVERQKGRQRPPQELPAQIERPQPPRQPPPVPAPVAAPTPVPTPTPQPQQRQDRPERGKQQKSEKESDGKNKSDR